MDNKLITESKKIAKKAENAENNVTMEFAEIKQYYYVFQIVGSDQNRKKW